MSRRINGESRPARRVVHHPADHNCAEEAQDPCHSEQSDREPGCDGLLASDSLFRPSFTFEQIRTFLAVAAREHITGAARALQLSQPAVTQQVHLLERALGVRLLERVGRNVRLTDAGLEVAGACLLIMRSLENLEEIVQAVRGMRLGSLSLGASHVAANYYLTPALAAFAGKHPTIDVEISVSDTPRVCESVSSGRMECGLVDAPLPKSSDLIRSRVAVDEVVLVAHPDHPLVGADRLTPQRLQGQRYLVWEPGAATEALAAQMLGAVYPNLPRIQVASLEAVRQSLRCGLGFAAVPGVAVAEDLCRGTLARLPVPARTRPVYAIRRPGPTSLAAEAFWGMLCECSPRHGS